MAPLDPYSTASSQRHQRAKSPAGRASALPAPNAHARDEEILHVQLKCLIKEILTDAGTDMRIHMSLLRYLTKNPEHPEQALLAHLRDIQPPDDLPVNRTTCHPANRATPAPDVAPSPEPGTQ